MNGIQSKYDLNHPMNVIVMLIFMILVSQECFICIVTSYCEGGDMQPNTI